MSEKKWRVRDSTGRYSFLYWDRHVREDSSPSKFTMDGLDTLKTYKELLKIFPEEPNRFRIERVKT